jgi:hypothetical protein
VVEILKEEEMRRRFKEPKACDGYWARVREERFRRGRPSIEPAEAVKFCLDQLFAGCETWEQEDEVAYHLTFEELIGALLLAEDSIAELGHLRAELEELRTEALRG